MQFELSNPSSLTREGTRMTIPFERILLALGALTACSSVFALDVAILRMPVMKFSKTFPIPLTFGIALGLYENRWKEYRPMST